MLFWWEKDDDVIPVGRIMMLFRWETDDDVILVGEG